MEFVLKTDLGKELPKVIDFNHEALKAQLQEKLKYYNSLVVTEDSIREAKSDKAGLNNLKKALDAKRIEIKKEVLTPYEAFEGKVKELIGMIDEPVQAIDNQLKVFEEAQKAEKREKILAIYESLIGERADMLPFDRIFNTRWLNVTFTLKAVEEDISGTVARFDSDMAALDTVEGEYMEVVKAEYLDTLDLSMALAKRARLKDQAEIIRAREERLKREAVERAKVAPAPPPEVKAPELEKVDNYTPETAPTEKLYSLTFECQITKRQAANLKDFLVTNKIAYRRI